MPPSTIAPRMSPMKAARASALWSCAMDGWAGDWGTLGLRVGDADLIHDIILPNLLHGVETVHDLAEYRVNAVEVFCVRLAEHHEELASARVFAGVRHRERADLVRPLIARRL